VNSSPKGKIDVIQLDVDNSTSVKEAVAKVSKLLPSGLDTFISNAGVDLQSLVPFNEL
jgi:NADP-dependent 3-hydroxy acid dehydrogenase YdfG